uniref:Periphilin-1 C-terminal domain-containing protein n=1 Tax=Amphilophus citrinellus TaxID=61819 RepID=A0A3Q0R057_AMPCI
MELERRFNDDQWYGGPRDYHEGRGYSDEGGYSASDQRCFDENPNFGSFRRNSSPHRSPTVIVRDRSPARREGQPPVRSGSNTKNRNFSPDRDKSYTYQQGQHTRKQELNTCKKAKFQFLNLVPSEKTSASAAESEEVAAASMEPKLTPEQDIKHYRQDCETFRTVVNMLVEKEPSLDKMLQAPLDKNLLEIKQRCLDALRNFEGTEWSINIFCLSGKMFSIKI